MVISEVKWKKVMIWGEMSFHWFIVRYLWVDSAQYVVSLLYAPVGYFLITRLIFEEYNQQNATFLILLISVRLSTCFRRVFRLSSGAQNLFLFRFCYRLRCCVTNRKVAGSIPAAVSGFFIDIKFFRSHYSPGVESASNRNEYQEFFLGVKAAGA